MAKSDLNGGGAAMTGVRLTDIDIKLRRHHGGVLLNRALKEMEPFAAIEFAAELHRAVEEPSERIYWVTRDAVDQVLR